MIICLAFTTLKCLPEIFFIYDLMPPPSFLMSNMGSKSKSEEFEFTATISAAKRLKIHKPEQFYLYQISRLSVKKNPRILLCHGR